MPAIVLCLKEFVQEHSKDFQNPTLPLQVRQGAKPTVHISSISSECRSAVLSEAKCSGWLEKVRACATASKEVRAGDLRFVAVGPVSIEGR